MVYYISIVILKVINTNHVIRLTYIQASPPFLSLCSQLSQTVETYWFTWYSKAVAEQDTRYSDNTSLSLLVLLLFIFSIPRSIILQRTSGLESLNSILCVSYNQPFYMLPHFPTIPIKHTIHTVPTVPNISTVPTTLLINFTLFV